MLGVDENLENLKTAGVQQANREDKIAFSSVVPWLGRLIGAEGRYQENETSRRAGILIGPEFGRSRVQTWCRRRARRVSSIMTPMQ